VGLLWLVVAGACSPAAEPEPTIVTSQPTTAVGDTSTTGATVAATTTAPSIVTTAPATPPDHDVGVRVVNGVGEFYDRFTGERFVPRGMNYVRLGRQTRADGSITYGHSLFDPGQYDPVVVGADLQKMHADGYNVIRVFLSPDTMGTAQGDLSSDYLANVVDLLDHAAANSLYVMFTLDWLPGGTYGDILSADCCTEFALMNANFLPPAGLRANQAFFRDFAAELIRRNAATEHVFSYQLRNEMFYDSDQPPLSFTSGTVTTANGSSYDMASAADREAMLEENSVFWLDSVRAAILEVDPTALVSVGFFVPHGPNPARIGDPRVVVSAPAIWESTLDFIDVHAYAGFELDLLEHVENFGMSGMQTKPIVMGEFGGEVSRFESITAAALTFRDWQVESCDYGFDGWIFWTWDLDEQADFFNALMEGGAINGVLAPVLRPDPCVP
jgi:hypothetical protein